MTYLVSVSVTDRGLQRSSVGRCQCNLSHFNSVMAAATLISSQLPIPIRTSLNSLRESVSDRGEEGRLRKASSCILSSFLGWIRGCEARRYWKSHLFSQEFLFITHRKMLKFSKFSRRLFIVTVNNKTGYMYSVLSEPGVPSVRPGSGSLRLSLTSVCRLRLVSCSFLICLLSSVFAHASSFMQMVEEQSEAE